MPEIYSKPVWKCSFCPKLCRSLSGAKNHEKRCSNNPVNHQICFSCINLKRCEQQCAVDWPDGSQTLPIVPEYYCKALDQSMKTYKCPRRIEDWHPSKLHLMPHTIGQCEHYEFGPNETTDEILEA